MSDRKYEFRDWMNSLKLKSAQVTGRFGISSQTANHWRSKGVPESRQDFVTRTIAEWTNASVIGPRLQVQATDEQFRAWNLAANDCEGGPKTIEEWAVDGLNEMAREYFNDPQLKLRPYFPPSSAKVADDVGTYRTKNDQAGNGG